MSFYQEFDTPPPLNLDYDDENSSKLEDADFNSDIDNEIIETSEIPGIPQHHFYSSSPPPDDDYFANDSNDDLPPVDDFSTSLDCDEIVKTEETIVKNEVEIKQIDEKQKINVDESVTHISTEIVESAQEPIKIESLKTSVNENDDDNSDKLNYECFKAEDINKSETTYANSETFKVQDAEQEEEEFQFESFKATTVTTSTNELSKDHFESFKEKGFNESDEFIFESFQGVSDIKECPEEEKEKVEQFQFNEPISLHQEDNYIHFEADFSNFEAAFPIQETTSTNMQINHSIQSNQESSSISRQIMLEVDDDDDDDFGDFSDFTQATTTIVTKTENESQPSILTTKPDIGKIIDQSFPYEKIEGEEEELQQQQQKDVAKVLNLHLDNLMKYLKDIDVTLALNYDYKDSCTHNLLVKALGIDRRNILFGPKWNSASSSNVPRFASDLSFNPLQPQKSSSIVTVSDKQNVKDVETSKQLQQQSQPDIIPEVEFDWNGAGLKNPLDAKQAKPVDELIATKINSEVFDNDFTSKSEKVSAINQEEVVKHVWQDESFDISTNHVVVRERVIKLPETHIFTPIKSVSPVAISKDIPLDENKSEKTSIYVKEYHDVEYSLEPKFKNEPENDFDEFQSAVVVDESIKNVNSKLDILVPQNVFKSTKILQPESATKPQINSDFLIPQKVNCTSTQKETIEQITSDDFDFTEFQAAPCVVNQQPIVTTTTPPKEKEKVNSITLSPMHLVNSYNKTNNGQSENKTKYLNNAISTGESNCDDDWSDFVSSTTTTINAPSRNNDWSDFVSVPIVKPSIPNSSQFPSKPNFSSWNQPISSSSSTSKSYAVNHTTSFLSSYHPTDIGERKGTNKPMNITNNFNYGVDQCDKSYQHGMSNGISTILPDLQFAIPNNLINLSRANTSSTSNSGKK
ncbi:hypothetical protein PVAND_000695 [Polypedilum vanderplanki]|uniref:Aftiphilin clathrin-binding box domain-containing protein n=1 Tax=Polypedilum vanderplanki TaxID=319348 RepID=A0A9J6BM24_POLVA|nr:hypothetical protein PVAND_000695 [Polypedilum vanderplanki]